MNVYFKNKPKESKYRSMLSNKEANLSVDTAICIAVASLRRSISEYICKYKKPPKDMSCIVDVSGKYISFDCYEWFNIVSLPVSCSYGDIKIEMISESKARIEYIEGYHPIYERKQIFIIQFLPPHLTE